MSGARRLALLTAGLLVAAAPLLARAVIPSAERIADAVAEANREAGRAEPLWLEVTLRIGEGEPVATGILASHPTGLARLELRSRRGFVERHLLQGSEYRASRDGRLLESPRPFLPPVFLLQADSGAALRAALESFDVVAGEAVLGYAGDHDCYVFGGRPPPSASGKQRVVPSMWVDLETYDLVRVDRSDRVRFEFGPAKRFDRIVAPAWIAIHAPDQPPARLDIVRVAPANAPAAAFGTDWLTAPASDR